MIVKHNLSYVRAERRTRRGDHALNSMVDQSIMQPEAKTSHPIDHLDSTRPVAVHKRLTRFPSARDAPTPQLRISGSDSNVEEILAVKFDPGAL